jgi:hypothetical protein
MTRHLGLAFTIVLAACEGPAGPPGEMGEMGDDGVRGAHGEDGTAGPMGAKGDRGEDGEMGAMGAPGSAGDTGPEGARGPQGEPGTDGEDGEDGAQGPAGPQGNTGAQGPQGDPGPAGPAGGYYPELFFRCAKVRDLVLGNGSPGQDGITETYLEYVAVRFSNGDADVMCEGRLSSVESAFGGDYFPDSLNGSATAACSFGMDMPPDGGSGSSVGVWSFAVGASAPAATYSDDSGHPFGGMSFPYVEGDCVVELGSALGTWTAGTLTDVID